MGCREVFLGPASGHDICSRGRCGSLDHCLGHGAPSCREYPPQPPRRPVAINARQQPTPSLGSFEQAILHLVVGPASLEVVLGRLILALRVDKPQKPDQAANEGRECQALKRNGYPVPHSEAKHRPGWVAAHRVKV